MSDFQEEVRSSYHGNPNLKQIGHKHEFTEEQVRELVRCSADIFYFIEKYCHIISLDRGLVPFTLWDFQREVIDFIFSHRMTVLMMPRQQSKTTIAAAVFLWYTLFNDQKTVAILANKGAAAREVLSRYQIMYENLPIWLQQGVRTWNKGDVELENGSKVFTAATTLSGIRGRSINWLYIDEAAAIPNNVASEFFASIFPTISSGETTRILITSTPIGYNHFWKIWNEAEPKDPKDWNGFKRMEVPYHRHPSRTKEWAEEQRKLLGEVRYNQEVACQFLGSSKTLISGDIIAQMSSKTPKHITEEGVLLYELPMDGHVYVLCADTSRGVDADASAFTVIDVTKFPYHVAAKFSNNKISPLLYPNYIYETAILYNEALVLVEINDIGNEIAGTLHRELEYENLLWTTNEKGRTYLSPGFTGSSRYGVLMNKAIKRVGCLTLKSLVERQQLLFFDSDIIHEISVFVENKGTYAADLGNHDDLVMSLVLFAWLTANPYFKELMDVDVRKQLYANKMKQIEEELTPFILPDAPENDDIVVTRDIIWSNHPEKDLEDFFRV